MERSPFLRFASLAAVCSVLAAFATPTVAQSGSRIVIKLGWATADAPQDSFAIAAHSFKKALEAEGNDTFIVQLYPNRQIGDERQLVEGLRLGTVDVAIATNAAYSQVEPAFQLNDLPFLYKTETQVFEALDGTIGRDLSARIEQKGITMLAFLAGGYRHMLNNKRPVLAPADVAGVKYRVHNSVAIDMYAQLQAGPVPMAWGETMTALQQGAVDGLDLPIGVMDSLKIYEAVRYLSLTAHAYSGAALGISKRRFDRLSDEQKALVKRAAATAAAEQRVRNAENEGLILKTLKEKGLQINEVPDREAFRAKVAPLYEKMRASIDPRLLDAALAQSK